MRYPDITITTKKKAGQIEFFLRDARGGEASFGFLKAPPGLNTDGRLMRYLAAFEYPDNPTSPGPELRGKDFFSCLPRELQRLLWREKDHQRTLYIESTESWIPWEIMKLHHLSAGSYMEGDYLCIHFRLARWFPGSEPACQFHLAKGGLVCGEGLYADNLWSSSQIPLLSQIEEVTASLVETQMSSGNYDYWLFMGHVIATDGNPDETYFPLDTRHRLFPQTLNGRVKGMSGTKPLVLLGACSTGSEGQAVFGVGGWPRRFVEAQAGAFVGTLWPVSAGEVRDFAEAFLAKLIAGMALAEAFQLAREKTKLAFVLYGHPLAIHEPNTAKKDGPVEELTLAWRQRIRTIHPSLKVMFVAMLPILLFLVIWVGGLQAHRAREYYLSLAPLNYPILELIATGAHVVGSLPARALGVLFSQHPWMQWGCILSIVATCIFWRFRLRWQAKFGLPILLGWAAVLLIQVGFVGMVLRVQNQNHLPDMVSGSINWNDRLGFVGQTWLVNESPDNDRFRENLLGILVWAGLAIMASIVMLRRYRGHWANLVWVVYLVLAYLVLALLPRAYAFSYWGVTYPVIQVTSPKVENHQLASFEKGCCLFDVSAGASEMVIWVRCGGSTRGFSQPVARELIPFFQRLPGPKQVVFHAPCKAGNR